MRYAHCHVVLLAVGTMLLMSAEPELVPGATAAERCGGKTFEVVKHGRMEGSPRTFCVGGTAAAFAKGGTLYMWAPRERKLYQYQARRQGQMLLGNHIPNVTRRDGGTFTGKLDLDLSDSGKVTWHWVEEGKKYPGVIW